MTEHSAGPSPARAAFAKLRTAGFVRDRTLVIIGILAIIYITFDRLSTYKNALVIYCAHDAVFAESILKDFEKETGIHFIVRYDTEATKSLGLVELLKREKDAPHCDVFWNNELLGTADLAEQGLLEPYQGSGWKRMPEQWKDAEGRWTGFAGRLRVFISDREKAMADRSPCFPIVPSLEEMTEAACARAAMAKPLYGTTLTHYTVLWHEWGPEKLKTWHAKARQYGLREVNGNAVVKDLVASGQCDIGLTDTDDYFEAADKGAPVTMFPVRVGDRAICIPNTVAIVKGAPHQDAARRLVDYLLSAKTEMALARSKSRQIPLGPLEGTTLPNDVRDLYEIAANSVPLKDLGKARAECLTWLKSIYAE